jgi:hypothetical protein
MLDLRRKARLELRDARTLGRVDEARGVVPRKGAGRELVDGLPDTNGALGSPVRERDEGVAGRDALAQLQLQDARQDAVAGPAREGPPAAASVGIFFEGKRAILEECVGLALKPEL